ncbi:MAG TPA: GNAT family N-acetyltransferase [Rhizomicrobium sp.]|jgi:GNAT superfamily N-acetyltransferase
MADFHIRAAGPGDEATILSLLGELAAYEKLTDRFRLTPALIARDFFGPAPLCFCELGFLGDQPAGVMTWYRTYSSFAAAASFYLEDLYVRDSLRGRGLGKALLAHLAKRALREGAVHIEWAVLKWNAPSIAFYESLRAERNEGWDIYGLAGDALADLAQR